MARILAFTFLSCTTYLWGLNSYMTFPMLLAGHFAVFFSKQKLSFGRGRNRAECSLLQQLVVSWKELCVIDES